MSRWKIILRAWPPAGAVLVILSFLVTAFWLWHAITGSPDWELGWLEPLAGFLAGAGAFIVAAILIFRRVDHAEAETTPYGLARGLATGYYFNYIRPVVTTILDTEHTLHQDPVLQERHQIEGLVVGLPQDLEEFNPDNHPEVYDSFSKGDRAPFDLVSIEIVIPKRRPIYTKLALSKTCSTALVVDIPTTLSVIPDFAAFFAEQELANSAGADDGVVEAREQNVTNKQTNQFKEVLNEFIETVNTVGSKEQRTRSPACVLHVVPVKRLARRMDELADH